MQVVVSEMMNFGDLRENIAASLIRLSPKEARLLEGIIRRRPPLLPRLRPPLRNGRQGRAVATVLRYLRYEIYGKRGKRALYQAAPAARVLAEANLRPPRPPVHRTSRRGSHQTTDQRMA